MTKDGFFDDAVAETYDRDHGGTDPESVRGTVECLAALAGDGPVLEFAIGTGRIALPLAAQGVEVQGIELSEAMVRQMRGKSGGDAVDVMIGDMTTARVERAFTLVFLVFNTIDNLTTQEAQLACFENAASHLAPGGRFLIETLLPPLQHLPFGETKRAFARSDTHWGMDEIDIATQSYTSHHVWIDGERHQTTSIPFRYAWPAEMDLMARIAGLELEHRWADWSKVPFDKESTRHISVWRKLRR